MVKKGLFNEESSGFNFVRDTIFEGNEDLYYLMQAVLTQGAYAGYTAVQMSGVLDDKPEQSASTESVNQGSSDEGVGESQKTNTTIVSTDNTSSKNDTAIKAPRTDWEAEIPVSGEECNQYFNETYGAENVSWETASVQNIIEMPSTITNFTPEQLANMAQSEGWSMGPLNRRTWENIPFEQGGGFGLHPSHGGSEYIQYHPGGGHHGNFPYYKISSGLNGRVRYDLNGGSVQ